MISTIYINASILIQRGRKHFFQSLASFLNKEEGKEDLYSFCTAFERPTVFCFKLKDKEEIFMWIIELENGSKYS